MRNLETLKCSVKGGDGYLYVAFGPELFSKFIKVDGAAMLNKGQNETFVCCSEVVLTSSDAGVGVGIVHNAKLCMATKDLVDK